MMVVLLTGNLEIPLQPICTELARNHKPILASREIQAPKQDRRIIAFPHSPQDPLFCEAFRLYDVGAVVFFATREEQTTNAQAGFIESLSATLALCTRHKIPRFVYISSTELGSGIEGINGTSMQKSAGAFLLESGEKLCQLYHEQSGMAMHIVRIPYMYGDTYTDSLLGRIVRQAFRQETVLLPGSADQACDFVHAEDLAVLLERILDDATDVSGVLEISGGSPLTFGDIVGFLKERFPECSVAYSQDPASVPKPVSENHARQQYDWVALHEVAQGVSKIAEELSKAEKKRPSLWARTKAVLLRRRWILQLMELMLGFILMEYLITITGDSLQFQFIDIRLLFVVILGSMHGLRSGIVAALLACLSIIIAYIAVQIDWRAVLYNVDNWLPFVAYLLVGVVTGYMRDKSDNATAFERERASSEEKHYEFLNELYNQSLKFKDQYKTQLIGYRDSFGRVYEITRRLDRIVPDAIFQESVQILEDVMDNSSIAIYTIDAAKKYARLAVSSAGLADSLGRSIAISEYPEMFGRLSRDRVWINRQLLEKYPFYCVPIFHGASLAAVIMDFDVPFEQKSAAGANQFLVLCSLIQAALVRAIAYNEATEEQTCIAGTHILKKEKFAELITIRHEMRRLALADYQMLRVEGPVGDLVRLGEKLEQGIRRTDFIGQGYDGSICVLLAQAQPKAVELVMKRLESLGVRCSIAEDTASDTVRAIPMEAAGDTI